MAEVAIDVSGEMETPQNQPASSGFPSYFALPGGLPVIKTWLLARRHNIRPWIQFVHTNNFKPPTSIPRFSKRIMRNIEYFHSNYLLVFIGLMLYCLITSPLLLIAIVGSLFASYKLSKRHEMSKMKLLGRELTTPQIYGLVAVGSLPIYYLAGAGAIMFWVLGASFFVISLHAAFYNIEALEPEEESFGLTMEEV